MSGGKGGSTTQTSTPSGPTVTQVEIPEWLETAGRENLARAQDISTLGYRPYYGPDVAALTPMQEAAMQSTGMAAEAFGLPNALGNQVVPEAETFAGGVRGYSSGSLYDQAVAELAARNPGQYEAIANMFIDPQTGEMANQPAPAPSPAPVAAPTRAPQPVYDSARAAREWQNRGMEWRK